jgi:hypothetical protein
MTEQHAIHIAGKQFSEDRNFGDELPADRIKVGNSWVLPSELADAYDELFPPGPRQYRQATPRILKYTLNSENLYPYRGERLGVKIESGGRWYSFLESSPLFRLEDKNNIQSFITTSHDNRYDYLESERFHIVIDKFLNQASITWGTFTIERIPPQPKKKLSSESQQYGMLPHSGCQCSETAVWGDLYLSIDFPKLGIGFTQFPFVPFDELWLTWDRYVEFRRGQISQATSAEACQ